VRIPPEAGMSDSSEFYWLYKVEKSATDRSLVDRRPAVCVCVCVNECYQVQQKPSTPTLST